MDEKLVFRRARPADAARIMEIIRQAQAQMHWEACNGRTAIRQRPISDTTSLAATDGSSRNRRRKRAPKRGEATARGLRVSVRKRLPRGK